MLQNSQLNCFYFSLAAKHVYLRDSNIFQVDFMMDTWKNVYPTIGKSISEVVEEITHSLSKEKDANELCEKLKRCFNPPKIPPKRK